MAKTKFCAGLSDISDSYMGFILDEHGTLHDGEQLFPGVVDCLKELKERKKTLLILSNAPGRAEEHKERLKKMGLGPSLYHAIVTPAEVIYQGFKTRNEGVFENLGDTCYVFTRNGDISILEGTDVDATDDIELADSIIFLGMDYPKKNLHDYEKTIQRAIQRRLKAFCPVPPYLSMMGANIMTGPMLLARRYGDSGGIVNYIGKPRPLIFKYCVEILRQKDIYPSHTVMVGDTMAHDMIGAAEMDIDTCLTKSGLHAANFAHCENPKEVWAALKNLMAISNNVMPKYLVDEVKWGKALPDRKHKKRKQPAS